MDNKVYRYVTKGVSKSGDPLSFFWAMHILVQKNATEFW